MTSEFITTGSKLVTYDPHHPEWAGESAAADSANRRNVTGMLLEMPGTRPATRQLVVIHGDDVGEQTGQKSIRYIVDELLSGSDLARRLLYRFSFLIFPHFSQQGARDGFSRFPLDLVPDSLNNGGSDLGKIALTTAISNWCSTHPTPSAALFCQVAIHCDSVNHWLANGEGGNPATPTAPYGKLMFPGYETTEDGGVSVFRGDSSIGFDRAVWPEYFTPSGGNLIKGTFSYYDTSQLSYGGTTFYFEQPWRHAGHKASFFPRQDALKSFSLGLLEGLATVANAVEVYSGDATVTITNAVNVVGNKRALGSSSASNTSTSAESSGRKRALGTVGISATSSTTVTGTKRVSAPASCSSSGAATATGFKRALGTVSVTVVSSVEAHAILVKVGPASVDATSSTTVTGRKRGVSTVSVSASSTCTSSGRKRGVSTVGVSATGVATTTGMKLAGGPVSVTAVVTVSTTAVESHQGGTTVTASSSTTVTGRKRGMGAIACASSSSTSAAGWSRRRGPVSITATSYANAGGTLTDASGGASISATSNVVVTGFKSSSGSTSVTASVWVGVGEKRGIDDSPVHLFVSGESRALYINGELRRLKA